MRARKVCGKRPIHTKMNPEVEKDHVAQRKSVQTEYGTFSDFLGLNKVVFPVENLVTKRINTIIHHILTHEQAQQ
jgi:hypothetical protein